MKWIGRPDEWNYEQALMYFGRTFLIEEEIVCAESINRYEVLYTMDSGIHYIFNLVTTAIRRVYLSNEIDNKDLFVREFMFRFRSAIICSKHDILSLSIVTGISYATLKRYNSGDTLPTVYNLYLIAKELKCDVSDLLPIDR